MFFFLFGVKFQSFFWRFLQASCRTRGRALASRAPARRSKTTSRSLSLHKRPCVQDTRPASGQPSAGPLLRDHFSLVALRELLPSLPDSPKFCERLSHFAAELRAAPDVYDAVMAAHADAHAEDLPLVPPGMPVAVAEAVSDSGDDPPAAPPVRVLKPCCADACVVVVSMVAVSVLQRGCCQRFATWLLSAFFDMPVVGVLQLGCSLRRRPARRAAGARLATVLRAADCVVVSAEAMLCCTSAQRCHHRAPTHTLSDAIEHGFRRYSQPRPSFRAPISDNNNKKIQARHTAAHAAGQAGRDAASLL